MGCIRRTCRASSDWSAQRIRVRNAYTRKEHSSRGKSDLSTSRSVPMADRVVAVLDGWSKRSAYTAQSEPRRRWRVRTLSSPSISSFPRAPPREGEGVLLDWGFTAGELLAEP